MSAPYYFEQLNQYDMTLTPGTLKREHNLLAAYFRRYLAQRAFAIYEWKGLPDNWDQEYLKYTLMIFGVAAVFKTDKFGVIPQACGISGYNVFYRPTRAIVTNPLFNKSYSLLIGKDCELIRLSPDWRGIADLIGHFADLLAINTTSIIVNLYNSRLAYVFTAGNKSMAESFKAMFDKIASGDPAVFADKQLFGENGEPQWQAFQQDLKSTFIVDLLHAAERAIMSQFYTHIGIPNIPFEKGERLNVAESTMHEYATECLADLWLRTMNDTAKKVNEMFGLNISVDYCDALNEAQPDVNGDADGPDNSGSDQIHGRSMGRTGSSNSSDRK